MRLLGFPVPTVSRHQMREHFSLEGSQSRTHGVRKLTPDEVVDRATVPTAAETLGRKACGALRVAGPQCLFPPSTVGKRPSPASARHMRKYAAPLLRSSYRNKWNWGLVRPANPMAVFGAEEGEVRWVRGSTEGRLR